MKISRTGVIGLLAAGLAGWLPALAPAATIDLTGLGFVQYGDAMSYSLPISQIQQGGCPGTGCPWKIDSTPGAIKDLIVIATGADGVDVTTNIAGIEGAYGTPSGVNGSTFFSTGTFASPGYTGTIANASALTWDANLLALKSFLAGNQLVFFFNNNQVNSGDSSLQSLAAWARVTVTDPGGAVINTFDFVNGCGAVHGPAPAPCAGGPTSPYATVVEGGGGEFLGDVTHYTSSAVGAPGTTGPTAGDNSATDYVLAGGQLCVMTGAGPVPIPVNCATPDPDGLGPIQISAPINHNLGANEAAYALLVPELNGLLGAVFSDNTCVLPEAPGTPVSCSTLGSVPRTSLFTLHLDVRLGCDPGTLPAGGFDSKGNPLDSPTCTAAPYGRSLNNGYEQIFIGTAMVPEPHTIALFGLGLLGMLGIGAATRRRRI